MPRLSEMTLPEPPKRADAANVTNVYGPPGTGKTTHCLNTVQGWLDAGVSPGRVGYVAFTRNASDESKERMEKLTGYKAEQLPWFSTLHSAAGRLIRQDWDKLAKGPMVKAFMKEIGIPYDPYLTEVDELAEQRVLQGNLLMSIWDFGRNRLHDAAEAAWDEAPGALTDRPEVDRATFQFFVKQYEEWKAREDLRDFTDLLIAAVGLGECPMVSHLVIDECQDLSPLQWQMARLMERGAQTILRAGDDDQCIFSWIGVRAEDFTNIEGEQLVLTQSYRIPKSVYDVAMRIISRNRKRVAKDYRSRDYEGSFRYHHSEELPPIPETGSVAFLYRNKKHLKDHAERLIEEAVPFGSNRVNTPLTNPKVRAGLEALYLFNEKGSISNAEHLAVYDFVRSGPYREEAAYGLGKGIYRDAKSRPYGQVTDLCLSAEGKRLAKNPLNFLGGLPAHIEYIRRLVGRYGPEIFGVTPRVFLTTVHGAKGREWDHVFLSQEALRNSQDGNSDNPEEENRLKYVGITRAKESLCVLPGDTWAI